MNWPNRLSLMRIGSVPVLTLLLMLDNVMWARYAALFLFIRVVCRNVYLPVGIGMFLCAVFDSFNSSIGLGQTDIRFSLFDPFISTYFLGNAAPQQYMLGDVWTYNRLLFFTLAILLLAASYAILRRDGLHQHNEIAY